MENMDHTVNLSVATSIKNSPIYLGKLNNALEKYMVGGYLCWEYVVY